MAQTNNHICGRKSGSHTDKCSAQVVQLVSPPPFSSPPECTMSRTWPKLHITYCTSHVPHGIFQGLAHGCLALSGLGSFDVTLTAATVQGRRDGACRSTSIPPCSLWQLLASPWQQRGIERVGVFTAHCTPDTVADPTFEPPHQGTCTTSR